MSRKIDPKRIASGDLTYAEALYLKHRGKLPADYEMPEAPEGEDGEEPEPGSVRGNSTPLENQSTPTIGNAGGIVDEDEDYEEGWNNDQRRAELSKRGLSVSGNKDELIARLRRSDAGELEDGDESDV